MAEQTLPAIYTNNRIPHCGYKIFTQTPHRQGMTEWQLGTRILQSVCWITFYRAGLF